jgi:hypothetical protein
MPRITIVTFSPFAHRIIVCTWDAVLSRRRLMMSFLAVTTLSFITLYLGTYVADRLENRRCSDCGQTFDEPGGRRDCQ